MEILFTKDKQHTPVKKKKIFPDAFKKIFDITLLKHNLIKAPNLLKWNIKKDAEYTINPDLNDRYEKKYGTLIDQGYSAKLYVKWINKTVEYGAYTDQLIKRGEMVCEYTGLVEPEKVSFEDNLYLWDYPTVTYKAIINKETGKIRRKKINYCINAEKQGNIARFINHSHRKYQNVDIRLVPRNNQWHVIYVAKKDILPGQQLLTYYGMQYWRDRNIVPFAITPDM